MIWGFQSIHRNPGRWGNGPPCRPNAIFQRYLSRNRNLTASRPCNFHLVIPYHTPRGGPSCRCRVRIRNDQSSTLERDGVHSASTLKFVSWNPSAAMPSILGVGRPTQSASTINANLAVTEIIHQTRTILGLSSLPGAASAGGTDTTRTNRNTAIVTIRSYSNIVISYIALLSDAACIARKCTNYH